MQSSLPEVLGHDRVLERFRRSLEQGRLASTFLFVGPPGVGKRTTAMYLAQCLLCEESPANSLVACGTCQGCQQVAAMTHPDLIYIAKPEDKTFIPVEVLIGDREHRMREGLCHDISLKPFRGGRKIAIIDDADYLNQEGANCLLKTLEEPPEDSIIILIGTSEQRQLPTIRSRCQVVRFAPLSGPVLAQLLQSNCDVDPDRTEAIASRAAGSLHRAKDIADSELDDAVDSMLKVLSQADWDSVALAKKLGEFVDAAGKDSAPRRARLRQVVRGALDFYRELMRQAADAPPSGNPQLNQFVDGARKHWRDAPTAAACADRCLDALAQVDANANLATLIPSWLDDLAELGRLGA